MLQYRIIYLCFCCMFFHEYPLRDRRKYTLLNAGVFSIEAGEKLLDILSLGMTVYRAGAFHHRELIFIDKSDYIYLIHIEHRTNDG